MKVLVTEQANVSTVQLEGSIDGKTAPMVRDQIQPTLDKAENVILDLSAVGYLSSAGLRLLLLIYREFAARKGKLVLVGVSPDIRMVMSHTGFLNFFTLADTATEAMRAMAA